MSKPGFASLKTCPTNGVYASLKNLSSTSFFQCSSLTSRSPNAM